MAFLKRAVCEWFYPSLSHAVNNTVLGISQEPTCHLRVL
ncbi:MAG: hypothetical protein ACI9SE_004167, partial [Neolewinella sp.]